jgi:hypothetical protein
MARCKEKDPPTATRSYRSLALLNYRYLDPKKSTVQCGIYGSCRLYRAILRRHRYDELVGIDINIGNSQGNRVIYVQEPHDLCSITRG